MATRSRYIRKEPRTAYITAYMDKLLKKAGNTVIDAVIQHLPIAEEKSKILERVQPKKFALTTAPRAENVDHIYVLKNFMEAFAEAPIPVVYPMHPRTKKEVETKQTLR